MRVADGDDANAGKRLSGIRAAAARLFGMRGPAAADPSPTGIIPATVDPPGAARSADRPGARSFLAIAEIDRFAALKRTIGYSLANTLIQGLCDRLRDCLPDAEVGRAGRSSIGGSGVRSRRGLRASR